MITAAAFTVVILAGTAVLAGFAVLCWWISAYRWIITRQHNVTVTRAQIRWRADYEDWLWTHGDPRGTYGRYTPYV